MVEENQVFKSAVKYEGVLVFKDFYKFCYDYLKDELGFDELGEEVYKEAIKGDEKEIKVKWNGAKKFDDYFKFKIKIEFRIFNLKNVEIQQGEKKLKMNKGIAEVHMKGILVSDYRGLWAMHPVRKFMRNVYEKWIIPSRIDKIETKLVGDCDEFMTQAKAYLDLEGKKENLTTVVPNR